MRTLGIIVVLIACVIGGAFAWYEINYPTYTYRYRMTVEVDVDGKLHSGSSVIEVRLQKLLQWPGPMPLFGIRVVGEAAFVDLGEGRNVIALLASGPNAANVDYPRGSIALQAEEHGRRCDEVFEVAGPLGLVDRKTTNLCDVHRP